MGAKGSVCPLSDLFKQSAYPSHPRVEAGPEAVVVEVVNDQFARIIQNYPKQMRSTRNTTMTWTWLKSLREKNFGQRCDENFQIAFASLVQKGTEFRTNIIGHMLIA